MANQDAYINYLMTNIPSCRMDFMTQNENRSDRPIRMDVLNFIADFLYNTGADPVSLATVFTSGYCYHFAVILQHEFGGTIRWLKNRSHMVWEDENGILYDIEGVYEISPYDVVCSLEELETCTKRGEIEISGLEEYRHRYLYLRPDIQK